MTPKKHRADMTPEEVEKIRKQDRLSALRRHRGDGGMVSNEKVRERLRFLIEEKGVPARYIAQRAGVTECMVLAHYSGRRRVGERYGAPLTECRLGFERKILGARFDASDVYLVPSHGVHRRVGALVRAGYPYAFLARQLGLTVAVFHRKVVTDARHKVRKPFHDEMATLYEKLSTMDPLDAGAGKQGVRYARGLGERKGFAPVWCWDFDTIDDPDAAPEWTGACGTEEGYRVHVRELLSGRPEMLPCLACREVFEVEHSGEGDLPFVFHKEALREEMDSRGITDQDLAVALDDPKLAQRVYRWRRDGDRDPRSRAMVADLARVLEVPLHRLLHTPEDLEITPALVPPGKFNRFLFRVAIESSGISQREAADIMGADYGNVNKWCRGAYSPQRRELLEPLASRLGVGIEVFYA